MCKAIKRLLTAVIVILAVSVPSVAYARFFEYVPRAGHAGSSTSGEA